MDTREKMAEEAEGDLNNEETVAQKATETKKLDNSKPRGEGHIKLKHRSSSAKKSSTDPEVTPLVSKKPSLATRNFAEEEEDVGEGLGVGEKTLDVGEKARNKLHQNRQLRTDF